MYVPSLFWFFSLGECSGATAYSRRPPRPDRRHRHHVQQKVQSLERHASALPRCDRPNREARPGPGEGMAWAPKAAAAVASCCPGLQQLCTVPVHVKSQHLVRGGAPAFTRRKCMWLAGAAAYGHGRVGDWSCPVGRTRVTGTAGGAGEQGMQRPRIWARGPGDRPASLPAIHLLRNFGHAAEHRHRNRKKVGYEKACDPGGVPASRDIVCVCVFFYFFLIKSLISVFNFHENPFSLS